MGPTTWRQDNGASERSFGSIRDSRGQPVSDEVALRVQIGMLRALPVPWSPPMPDFDPTRVHPVLVAEAVASRVRCVVPALQLVGLVGIAAEFGRCQRLLDAMVRVERARSEEPVFREPVLAVVHGVDCGP